MTSTVKSLLFFSVTHLSMSLCPRSWPKLMNLTSELLPSWNWEPLKSSSDIFKSQGTNAKINYWFPSSFSFRLNCLCLISPFAEISSYHLPWQILLRPKWRYCRGKQTVHLVLSLQPVSGYLSCLCVFVCVCFPESLHQCSGRWWWVTLLQSSLAKCRSFTRNYIFLLFWRTWKTGVCVCVN